MKVEKKHEREHRTRVAARFILAAYDANSFNDMGRSDSPTSLLIQLARELCFGAACDDRGRYCEMETLPLTWLELREHLDEMLLGDEDLLETLGVRDGQSPDEPMLPCTCQYMDTLGKPVPCRHVGDFEACWAHRAKVGQSPNCYHPED